MLLTTRHEIARRLNSPNFSALVSQNEVHTCRSYGVNPVVGRYSKSLGKPLLLARCLLAHPKLLPTAFKSQNTARQILQADDSNVVMDISGYAYGDPWGSGSARRTLAILNYCKAKSIPYIFLPQAWGTFADEQLADTVARMCKDAGLVYARDKRSLACLTDISDAPPVHKEVMPDVAFKFQGESQQAGSKVLEKCGINVGDDSFIGIVPNEQVSRRASGKGNDNAYVKAMIRTVDYCVEQLGALVVLIPHHIARTGDAKTGDLPLCALIRDGVKNEARCVSLNEDYSAAILKAVIGQMDMVVASRYHSLIAALSNSVPAVAIGWSHKYGELLGLFGMEEYSIDFAELDKTDVFGVLKKAWSNRSNNGQIITRRLPAINQQLDAMFDHVARLIENPYDYTT